MEKTIVLGEKSIKIKSSAATNILYKRLFHEDILVTLTSYTKNLKDLQAMQEKMKSIREDSSKTQEQILAEMNEMLNSDVFTKAQTFQSETLPKLAYIMYLEANEGIDTIFKKLTEEQYLFWLMTINQDELLAVVGEVMEVWQSGAKTHSKPNN
jgi:hypothetical protein